MKGLVFILSVCFMLAGHAEVYAQKGSQIRREVKKMRAQNARASKRAAKYGKKRHLSIQDKATRKRMKQNLRNSNRNNKRLRR